MQEKEIKRKADKDRDNLNDELVSPGWLHNIGYGKK